jgi:hypothetical protein
MCVRGSQDSERSCKCVLEEARIVSDRVLSVKGVHFPVSMIFLLY